MPSYHRPSSSARALRLLCLLALAVGAVACGDDESGTDSGKADANGKRPLAPPGFVTGAVDGANRALFEWLDPNTNEDGYLLQRRLPNTTAWALVGVYPSNASGAVDAETSERATYFYRVVAFRSAETAPSTIIRLTFADETAPNTEIIFLPPPETDQPTAEFIYRSSEGAGTFACELDGEEYPCTTEIGCLLADPGCRGSQIVGPLADGTHTFQVAARDNAGNIDPTPALVEWIIDTAPPEITLTDVPPLLTNQTTAQIHFTIDESDVDVTCKLNNELPEPCSSPFRVDLGDTPVSNPFVVITAVDRLGNSSDVTYRWEVDVHPPDIGFFDKPGPLSQHFAAGELSIGISIDDRSALRTSNPIECRWDWAENSFSLCAAVKGQHTIVFDDAVNVDGDDYSMTVRATDQWGHTTDATYTWEVDGTAAPITFVSTPHQLDNEPGSWGTRTTVDMSALRYEVTSTTMDGPNPFWDVRSFFCLLDGDVATAPCDVVHERLGVGTGSYRMEVTAVDEAGNESDAIFHTVDVTYPGYTEDPCEAGGDVLLIRDVPKSVGQINAGGFEQSPLNVTPLDDPYWERLYEPIRVDFSYRIARDKGQATTTRYLWGPFAWLSGSVPTNFAVSATAGNDPACGTKASTDARLSMNHIGQAWPGVAKWEYDISFRASDTNKNSAALQQDVFGMTHPGADHVILRHQHPPRGWFVEAGQNWQFRTQLYSDTGLETPTTVWARAPEGDLLAQRDIDWQDLDISRFKNADGRLDLVAPAPYCAGWMAIGAEFVGLDPSDMRDELHVGVRGVTAEVLEAAGDNNTATDATALAIGGTLPNLLLQDVDWYDFGSPTTTDELRVTVAFPAAITEDVTVELFEDTDPGTGIALSPVIDTDSGNGSTLPDYSDTDLVEIVVTSQGDADTAVDYLLRVRTAGAYPDCMRYRVEVAQ